MVGLYSIGVGSMVGLCSIGSRLALLTSYEHKDGSKDDTEQTRKSL